MFGFNISSQIAWVNGLHLIGNTDRSILKLSYVSNKYIFSSSYLRIIPFR